MEIREALQKYETYRLLNRKSNTVGTQLQELKRFFLFARKTTIQDIKLDDVISYLAGLQEFGWDPNSIREKSSNLRRFFHHYRLQGMGVLHEELIPLPRRVYKMPHAATEDQITALLDAIPTTSNDPRHARNRAMIGLLIDTGARNSEICDLNIDDMDLLNMRSIIATKKSRGTRPFRQIFWQGRTNDWLHEWFTRREYLIVKKKLKLEESKALFFSLCGGMHGSASGKRITPNGFDNFMRSYSKRAGIKTLNPHSFRHFNGHEIINQGGNNSDVANLLGHSSLSSTFIYTQMRGREAEERYRKLRHKSNSHFIPSLAIDKEDRTA